MDSVCTWRREPTLERVVAIGPVIIVGTQYSCPSHRPQESLSKLQRDLNRPRANWYPVSPPWRCRYSLITPSQRSLVLDYLSHQCYTRTARAFAEDSSVRHLDADGDEVMQPADGGSSLPELSEEVLKQADQRAGAPCALRGSPLF